jgi:hypothetical protein
MQKLRAWDRFRPWPDPKVMRHWPRSFITAAISFVAAFLLVIHEGRPLGLANVLIDEHHTGASRAR